MIRVRIRLLGSGKIIMDREPFHIYSRGVIGARETVRESREYVRTAFRGGLDSRQ